MVIVSFSKINDAKSNRCNGNYKSYLIKLGSYWLASIYFPRMSLPEA